MYSNTFNQVGVCPLSFLLQVFDSDFGQILWLEDHLRNRQWCFIPRVPGVFLSWKKPYNSGDIPFISQNWFRNLQKSLENPAEILIYIYIVVGKLMLSCRLSLPPKIWWLAMAGWFFDGRGGENLKFLIIQDSYPLVMTNIAMENP